MKEDTKKQETTSSSETFDSSNRSQHSTTTNSLISEEQSISAVNLSTLTAKNSDYIHAITRQLILSGKTDTEVKDILADIVPQILESQKDGITARTLLGTPTDFVDQYKNKSGSKEDKKYNDNPWLMWMDNSLLVYVLLAFMNGLMVSFEKNAATSTYGLAAIILSAITGGGALYIVYRMNYIEKDAEKKPSFRGHRTIVMIAALLVWFAVTFASFLLPSVINPHFSGEILLVSSIVVFAIRYWLRTQLKIQPSMAARVRKGKDQNKK